MTTHRKNLIAKHAPTSGAGFHTSTDKKKRTRQDELEEWVDELEDFLYEDSIDIKIEIEEDYNG